MIAYDVTKPDSMEALPGFIEKLSQYLPESVPFVILANKIDLDP